MSTNNLGLRFGVGPSVTEKGFNSIIDDIRSGILVLYNNNNSRVKSNIYNLNKLLNYLVDTGRNDLDFSFIYEVYKISKGHVFNYQSSEYTVYDKNYIDIDDLYALYQKFVLNNTSTTEYCIKTTLLC